MKKHELLARIEWGLRNNPGKPTQEEVVDSAYWFMALQEAEDAVEMNKLSDWACVFRDGLPALKDQDMQEWLDNNAAMHDEDEEAGDATLIANMNRMGLDQSHE